MSLNAKRVKLGLYWDPSLSQLTVEEKGEMTRKRGEKKTRGFASSVSWLRGRHMPWDLVSDAAMGEKNTHFRSQKQVRHSRAAATNTSTKTTTAVVGDGVVRGNRKKRSGK